MSFTFTRYLPRFVAAFLAFSMVPAAAQVSIVAGDPPVTQDFDTLSPTATGNAWTDHTTLTGWYSSRTTYNAGTGSSNAGALYSFGISGVDTERALGSIGSGSTGTLYYALRLANAGTSVIGSVDIAYTGEQWRDGGNTTAHRADFQYQIAAAGTITDANVPSTGWIDANGLDFTGPKATATSGALDGNDVANRVSVAANIPVIVEPGQELWLRWVDPDQTGSDHGLAIDDVLITANAALPRLSIANKAQAEGDGGNTMTFEVTLGFGDGTPFDVAFDTQEITATAGVDYVETMSGTLHFDGDLNETEQISIMVNGDTDIEANERFSVTLSAPTNNDVHLIVPTATGLILNDDAPVVAIHDIQGSGHASSFNGLPVEVEGAIVTAITLSPPAASTGFFIQTANGQDDGDDATSEGVFVFTGFTPAVAVGDQVTVTGVAQEFFNMTQIGSVGAIQVTASGQALPTAVAFSTASGLPSGDPADLSCPGSGPEPANPLNSDTNFECFESMRIALPTGIVTRANLRRSDDLYAEVFVMPHGQRSRREAGLLFPRVPGAGNAAAGQFDGNPELFEMDPDEAGLAIQGLTAGTTFDATGVMAYSFGDYEFYPTDLTVTQPGPVPDVVTTPIGGDQLTVATFNAQHLCDDDTSDDCNRDTPGTGGSDLNYANKLIKVANYVCDVLQAPDVVGMQEVDTQATLADLATQIGTTCAVTYSAHLLEGDDPGGIDVGFLTRDGRIGNVTVAQFFKGELWPDPAFPEILHDRPPLLLRADFNGNSVHPFALLNNHTKSIGNVDGSGLAAERDRAKRFRQARDIATLVQQFQTAAGPFAGQGTNAIPLILVGDYNAFEYGDGHVDAIGLISGRYDDDANECSAFLSQGEGVETCNLGINIVDPPLFNTALAVPTNERITYQFTQNFGAVQGSTGRDVPAVQTIDHILLARSAQNVWVDTEYGIGNNAAPEEDQRTNAGSLRASDHDGLVAYLDFACSVNPIYDPDTDGVCTIDNCPNNANPGQEDPNADQIGAACNALPIFATPADDTATEGTLYSYTVVTSDADGNALTLTAPTLPAWLNFTPGPTGSGSGTLSGTPEDADLAGNNAVELRLSDGEADPLPAQAFTIAIASVEEFAVAAADGTPTPIARNEDSGANVIDVLANDVADPDNNRLEATAVTDPPNGVSSFTPGGVAYAPDADYCGADSFAYTLNDGGDPSTTATVSVQVACVNDAPSFTAAGDVSSDEDALAQTVAWASAILAGPANESGQTLSFEVGNDNNVLFSAQPAISPTGALTYTAAPHANGVAVVTVALSDNGDVANGGDNRSGEVQFTLTVNAVNDKPTATAQFATTDEDTAIDILLSGTDVENAPLNVAIASNPSNGTVVLNGATATYTPAAEFNGSDSFTFVANDGETNNGTSDQATVTIAVSPVNDAPVTDVEMYATNQDTTLVVTAAQGVLVGDTDVEGSDLTATLATNVGNGALTLSVDGSFTYTPSTGFVGVDRFFYRASDGDTTSAVTEVVIAVGDTDSDNDGLDDADDNCPSMQNADQANSDNDAFGDICDPDDDNDGDLDGDDNCPFAANSDQADLDGDNLGNTCDDDDDGDSVLDGGDNCPLIANIGQANADGDAFGDVCDADDDSDGLSDGIDNCPLVANPGQENGDGDLLGDACDTNNAPTMTPISDAAVNENGIVQVTFTIADNDDILACSDANLSATSSNTTLLPVEAILFSGTDGVCTATLTPVPGASGTSAVSITLNDNSGTATAMTLGSFSLSVLASGDDPLIFRSGFEG